MFSTHNQATDLYVRTRTNSSQEDFNLGAGYLGTPHLFRIEWTGAGVDYFIDGAPMHSAPLTPTVDMRPLVSDYNANGLGATVDSIRLSPYAASGTWESAVFDSGADGSTWQDLTWTATEPAGTTVDMRVRGGDTATVDGTWSAYAPVMASGRTSP